MMATCICGRKEIAGLGRSHLCPHPDGPKWSVRQGVPKANVSAETLSASQKSRLRYETKRSTPVLDLTETEGHHQMTFVGYARVSSTDQGGLKQELIEFTREDIAEMIEKAPSLRRGSGAPAASG